MWKKLLPLLILLLAAAGYYRLQVMAPTTPLIETTEKTWKIDAVQIDKQAISPVIKLHARAVIPNPLRLRAAYTADLAKLRVGIGQAVEQGELLAQLDDFDWRIELEKNAAESSQVRAEIESEKIQHAANQEALIHDQELVTISQRSLQRLQKLAQARSGSIASVDDAMRQLQQQSLALIERNKSLSDHPHRLARLEARLAILTSQRDMILRQQQKSRLLAPVSGRVTDVLVATHDRVQVGEPLIELYAHKSIQLRALLPSRYQKTIQQLLDANHSLSTRVRIDGHDHILILDRLSAEIKPSRGGVDVYYRFSPGVENMPMLGSTLLIEQELPPIAQTFLLPDTAVYGNDRIYQVIDDRLHPVQITVVGERLNKDKKLHLLARSEQLIDADWIMTTPLPNAVAGLKVQIKDAQ